MAALTRHQNSLYRRKNINSIYQRKNTRSIYGGGWWDNVKKFGQRIWDNRDKIIEIGKKIGESGIIGNVKDLFNKVKTGDYKGAVDIAKVGTKTGTTIFNDNQDTIRNILGIGRKRGGARLSARSSAGAMVMPGGAMSMPGGAMRMPGGAMVMPGGARSVLKKPDPRMPLVNDVLPQDMPNVNNKPDIMPRKYVKKMSKQYIRKITGKGITRL